MFRNAILYLLGDGPGQCLKFGFRQVQPRLCEIDVSDGIHGNEMDVHVGHFQSYNGRADTLAGDDLLEPQRYLLGEKIQLAQRLIAHIEDVVDLLPGDHKCVSLFDRPDIKKGNVRIVLGNDVAGNLALNDLREDAAHRAKLPSLGRLSSDAGSLDSGGGHEGAALCNHRCRHCFAEQKALCMIAADFSQCIPLLNGFHALRRDAQAKTVSHGHDGFYEGC